MTERPSAEWVEGKVSGAQAAYRAGDWRAAGVFVDELWDAEVELRWHEGGRWNVRWFYRENPPTREMGVVRYGNPADYGCFTGGATA